MKPKRQNCHTCMFGGAECQVINNRPADREDVHNAYRWYEHVRHTYGYIPITADGCPEWKPFVVSN